MASYDAAAVLDRAIAAGRVQPDPGVDQRRGRQARPDLPRRAATGSSVRRPTRRIQKWYLRQVRNDGQALANVMVQDLATVGALTELDAVPDPGGRRRGYGLLLFVVAAGLTLAFGVGDVLNLAHGTLFAFGAYAAAKPGADLDWVALGRTGRALRCWADGFGGPSEARLVLPAKPSAGPDDGALGAARWLTVLAVASAAGRCGGTASRTGPREGLLVAERRAWRAVPPRPHPASHPGEVDAKRRAPCN